MVRKSSHTQLRLRQLVQEIPPSRFLDYRHFFRHIKDKLNEEFHKYTYGQYSTDLGFNKQHVAYILVNDVRKLSPTYLGTIQTNLQLIPQEKKYLRALVDYTHAKEGTERQRLFEKLVAAKTEASIIDSDKWELKFFTNWWHGAIFELFEVEGFESHWEWIAGQFLQPLSREQIEESLQLLQLMGLVAPDEKGKLVKTKASVSASESVLAIAKAGYHMQMMERAKDALNLIAADEREFGATTLALSEPHYQRLTEDLKLFRRYAIQLADLSEQKNRVVQLNFQLFPLTQGKSGRKDLL